MADRNSFDRSSSEVATSPALAPTDLSGPPGLDQIPPDVASSQEGRNVPSQEPDQNSLIYNSVVQSDIGVNTLLARLKQSVASARDVATFLKKRLSLEEDHAHALRKLSRATFESSRRPDSRQGSYSRGFEDLTRIQDRVAENGLQFSLSLSQMHDDLQELANEKERGRKLWKQNGLLQEKKVQDAEAAMEKAKAKYNSLAEDYDRARTGDKQSGRFGLKGPKSAAQVEEDLNRKMQAADSDYASKVQTAQALRQELMTSLRPQAVKAIEQLINESDSGVTLQLQKFAMYNEKLILGNGTCISPLKDNADGEKNRSLRDIVAQIDNEQDLKIYVTSFASKVSRGPPDLKYERHPTQKVAQPPQPKPQPASQLVSQPVPQSVGPRQPPLQMPNPAPPQFPGAQVPPMRDSPMREPLAQNNAAAGFPYQSGPIQSYNPSAPIPSQNPYPGLPQHQRQPSLPMIAGGPPKVGLPATPHPLPQLQPQPQPYQQPQSQPYPQQYPQPYPQSYPQPYPQSQPQSQPPQQHSQPYEKEYGQPLGPSPSHSPGPPQGMPYGQAPPYGRTAGSPSTSKMPGPPNGLRQGSLPPTRPVFGVSLDDLFGRDGSAVPVVVIQCIQAVESYGLEVEGIYRLSGTATHIQQLRAMFDQDPSSVDFRNPETFYHDVNSVAGLLKQFFRDLPDPLFTKEHYQDFVDAAHIDDDSMRRDSLHATINSLPDSNYATLRALALHLHRIQEHSAVNRMTAANLAICFGPTLMVSGTVPAIADAGWQVRAVDTILQNTLQIFDDD